MPNTSHLRLFVLFVYQVKVIKGGETVTAFFNKAIGKYPERGRWYSGKS